MYNLKESFKLLSNLKNLSLILDNNNFQQYEHNTMYLGEIW